MILQHLVVCRSGEYLVTVLPEFWISGKRCKLLQNRLDCSFVKNIFVFKSDSYLRILVTSPGSCPEYEMKTCVQVWLTDVELGASLLIQLENTQQLIVKLHLHSKMAYYVTLSNIEKDLGFLFLLV